MSQTGPSVKPKPLATFSTRAPGARTRVERRVERARSRPHGATCRALRAGRSRAWPSASRCSWAAGSESGPLAPKIATWNCCPGCTSRPSTTRFGALKPATPGRRSGRAPAAGAVDPDLGVVVEHGLEDQGRAGRVEAADVVGHGDPDAVPAEGEAAVAAAGLERRRRDLVPGRVLEVGGCRPWARCRWPAPPGRSASCRGRPRGPRPRPGARRRSARRRRPAARRPRSAGRRSRPACPRAPRARRVPPGPWRRSRAGAPPCRRASGAAAVTTRSPWGRSAWR